MVGTVARDTPAAIARRIAIAASAHHVEDFNHAPDRAQQAKQRAQVAINNPHDRKQSASAMPVAHAISQACVCAAPPWLW